ncbi:MAG: hypothetical protein KKB59_10340 [Spirochaetes bacterium]|nr:hypothetical protein [Spirochaetota bacterium]
MATCKQIAEKKGVPIAVVRKACHALDIELPRGRGKTFDASAATEKRIGTWIDEYRKGK